jgi:hypothetical protein
MLDVQMFSQLQLLSHKKVHYFYPTSLKLYFSLQILFKIFNIKFHENPSSGCIFFHLHRRTEEKTEVTQLVTATATYNLFPRSYQCA